MLGVLVFGFCGFLSFCVGVCRFLAGACWLWLSWFCFLCWCGGWWCVYLRVSSSRRRLALRSCTTFYKLDLRFTYLTRRKSWTL